MEVTPVSPSPTSPTAGDDLCDINVTNVAIHSVTLLISLCGLVGNGAVLSLLSLKDRNSGIFHLAFADFLFLLFTFPSAFLFLVEDMSCSPILPLPYLSFLFQLSVVSSYWALFRLPLTNKLVNIFSLWCRCKLPKRLVWLLFGVKFWAFFALFTAIPAVTYTCPSHQQEHCRAALISVYALILFLFAAPVLIFQTIDFIKATWGSKKQQIKRCDIVISLLVLFVLLLSLWDLLQQLGYTIVSSQGFFLLNCIHSSIKPFIYFLAGGSQRSCSLKSLQLSLQRIFEEPQESAAHSNDPALDTVL